MTRNAILFGLIAVLLSAALSDALPTHHVETQDVCKMEKEVGPCKESLQRWYYDATTKECDRFTYGGCEGNVNNFGSWFECADICPFNRYGVGDGVYATGFIPIPQNPTPPPYYPDYKGVCMLMNRDVGPCGDYYLRWSYDYVTKTCLPFIYGGCGGNQNNFEQPEDCVRTCYGFESEYEEA